MRTDWRTWWFGPDWYEFRNDSPYWWPLIEIKRKGYDDIQTVNPAELPPELNVYDLLWRPAPGVEQRD